MVKIKKFATGLSLVLILAVCGIGLAACGEPTPKNASITVSETFKTEAEAVLSTMEKNVLNKLTKVDEINGEADPNKKGTYTVEEAQQEVAAFTTYYVKVGTLSNVDTLESMGFGDITYTAGQTIELSVGNNKYIKDEIYYVEDNDLYMAAPILLVESAGQDKINLNGKAVDFIVSDPVETIKFTDVKFCFETTNDVSYDDESDVYTCTYREAAGKSMIGFYYDGNAQNDLSINRLYKNGELNSYSIVTNTDIDKDGNYPLTYYLIPWVTSGDVNEIDADRHNNAEFVLNAYIQGKGVATATVINVIEYTNTNAE